MDSKNILAIINDLGINNISFKIIILLFSVFYCLFALVIDKQVKIMDKSLQDKHNWFILLITSLQVTVSLILLIILILTIFIV